MKKKKFLALTLCFLLLAGMSACRQKQTVSSVQPDSAVSPGQEKPLVPDFTLQSNHGKEVSLSDYSGKVVVLNFWASWCTFCVQEMPDLQELNNQIKDSKEVALLLINQTDGQRETKEKADRYLSEHNFQFLSLYDAGEVGAEIFGLNSLPATVVIDKEGRVSDYILGRTDGDTIRKMIEGAK